MDDLNTYSKVNKYRKLEWFYNQLVENEWFDLSTCEWSEGTSYRYLKELKERYGCSYTKKYNCIRLDVPADINHLRLEYYEEVTKFTLMTYFILKTIISMNGCTREELIESVYAQVAIVSVREIDKWCKRLIEEGKIKKRQIGKQIEYYPCSVNNLSEINKKEFMGILTHYSMFLPKQKNLYKLLYKLGIGNIRFQEEHTVELTRAIEVVSQAKMNDEAIIINTVNGTRMSVVALYLFYNTSKKKWYIRYVKNSIRSKTIHRIKLDAISSYDGVDKSLIDIEKQDVLYKKARAEDNITFASTYEQPVSVVVLFEKSNFVLDKAYKRLEFFGEFSDFDENYQRFEGVIFGKTEFYKWLRAFGRSALLLKPDEDKAKFIKGIEKTLSYYEGV